MIYNGQHFELEPEDTWLLVGKDAPATVVIKDADYLLKLADKAVRRAVEFDVEDFSQIYEDADGDIKEALDIFCEPCTVPSQSGRLIDIAFLVRANLHRASD